MSAGGTNNRIWLPRDARGNAAMPQPQILLSIDLYACAAGVFFATGTIMLLMLVFDAGAHQGDALDATDLYVLGAQRCCSSKWLR